jgi:D-serine dehydratase
MLPRIAEIDQWIVDATVKGFPGRHPPTTLGRLGTLGWNPLRGDVPLPIALLKQSAIDNNRRWMRQFLAASSTMLAPHGKTTMSPQLMHAQLQDGAWGMTCATISQLQVYRRFGIQRVLIANQIMGEHDVDYLVSELARDPDFEPYVLVDSVAGVERLAAKAAAMRAPRPLRLLIEVGQQGVRTGARDLDAVRVIVHAVERSLPWLALHGTEAYEGAIKALPEEAAQRTRAMLDFQIDAARLVAASEAARDARTLMLSAGGSQYFDIVARQLTGALLGRPVEVVLRCGCYIAHDHVSYASAFADLTERGLYRSVSGALVPALEVWGCVQSRPETTRAYVTGGKRDLSFDLDLPQPIAWYRPGTHASPQPLPGRMRVLALNDQHTHLDVDANSPLQPGDLLGFGISHPCTTFDKWQLIYIVDDDYDIVDAIRTYF